MSELANNAVTVCGNRLNQHPHAARPVALEHHFFILLAFELAGAAKNGALDVFVRHVFILGRGNSSAKARIGVWVAAADARRDSDFANNSRENAAALCVRGRFLVLDGCPL